jgi:hypothetical protein
MKKTSSYLYSETETKKTVTLILSSFTLVCLIVLLLSCGKKSNPTTSLPPSISIDVTGVWVGFYLTSLVTSTPVTLNLTQSSATVTGTYSSSNGAEGTVSGTVNGNSIDNFTLIQTTPECLGSFSGSATVSGDTMNFFFSGSDCWGTHRNGLGRVVCDKTPPTVISTYPANNDTGVSVNTNVTVTFSETMDASTITGSTFTLKDNGNNPVSGSVSGTGNTATFIPSSSLAKSTAYTATVTTGTKDLANNPLAANHVWKFTTSAISSTYQTPEGWSLGAPMPTARDWAASAVVDDHVFVIGGATPPPYTYDDVEKYNTSMNAWTVLRNMPFDEFLIRGAAVNGKIYVFGSSMDRVTYSYDPDSDSWTKLKDFPNVKWIGSPAVVNGKIYVFGGIDENYEILYISLEYNPLTDTWAYKKSMPTKRYAPATAVYGNKIYVLGGNYGTDRNEVYDPSTDTWQTKASIPFDNYGWGVAGEINGKIYFVDSGTNYTPARMGIYTISSNSWSVVDGPSTPRDYLTGEVAKGRLYIIGGLDTSYNSTDIVDIYTPSASGKASQGTVSRNAIHGGNVCDFYFNKHLMNERNLKEALQRTK